MNTNTFSFSPVNNNPAIAICGATISSPEFVDLINADLISGEPVFKHHAFMKKVSQVLGLSAAQFGASQKYGNNNTRLIYNFPKREAFIVAQSFNYKLTAKVYDHITELEAALTARVPAIAAPASFHEALLVAIAQEEQRMAQSAQIAADAPQKNAVDKVVTLADMEQYLPGVDVDALAEDLRVLGYLYFANGKYRVYAKYRTLFGEM